MIFFRKQNSWEGCDPTCTIVSYLCPLHLNLSITSNMMQKITDCARQWIAGFGFHQHFFAGQFIWCKLECPV